jgi:hypothetical protein
VLKLEFTFLFLLLSVKDSAGLIEHQKFNVLPFYFSYINDGFFIQEERNKNTEL